MIDIPILTHLFELRKKLIENIGDSLNSLIHMTRPHSTHLMTGEKHRIVIVQGKQSMGTSKT
jgi:hypothetical protein